jgi:hypothetical protein
MHQLVKEAKTTWEWIDICSYMVRNIPSKNYLAECKRIFDVYHAWVWQLGIMRYIKDPHNVELVEGVWRIMERRATDCDGFSILCAASVGAIGHPYRFVTVNANPEHPDQPSHVYAEVLVETHPSVPTERGWFGMDLTVPKAVFGWIPTGFPTKVWPEPAY